MTGDVRAGWTGAGRRRPGGRALLPALLAGLLVVLLVAGLVAAVTVRRLHADVMDPHDPALRGPDAARAPVTARLGVFLGVDPRDVPRYEAWLGRPVDDVVQFADRGTWADIASPQQFFTDWRSTRYRTVFSLPMLPEQRPATVEQGAAGAYDAYFRTLATGFVRNGMAGTVFRVGWEFNLAGSRWSTPDSAAFVAYFRRIVGTMRSVPGQHFAFDWNPDNGRSDYDAVRYWPGDDVVDYVGVDAYDTSWARGTYPYPHGCDAACRASRQQAAWDRAVYGGRRGLQFWSAFARHHGKPLSLPEWGLWQRDDGHGGGSDPYYLSRMADFVADPANGVGYYAYFEFDAPDGRHTLRSAFPEVAGTYRQAVAVPAAPQG